MKILLSALLISLIIYLLPIFAIIFVFILSVLFELIREPIEVTNNIWCIIINGIRHFISKKKEDKDISNLEL